MTKPLDLPLWEGPCAYAARTETGYDIIVYSTNCVQHHSVGEVASSDRAEQITRRLNAYPRQTRSAFNLL